MRDHIDAEFKVVGEKPHEPLDWAAGFRFLLQLIAWAISIGLMLAMRSCFGAVYDAFTS